MDRILTSLGNAMPVDTVFLNLHGAMFAEGAGHAETVLALDPETQFNLPEIA